MRKTTIYLSDEEVDAVRRLAHASGASQAEVIRAAIRQAVANVPPRRFRSLARGRGPGAATPRWSEAELYEKAFGGPSTAP